MADIHFSQQPYYKALTASIQQLENPEWVTENYFQGIQVASPTTVA